MARLRDLGISIGQIRPGEFNTIADVPGVRVGHSTIISGDGSLSVGKGPVRTGVTAIIPPQEDPWTTPIYAASHTLNGTGEWTGLNFVNETGHLYGPVMLTNSHSVGAVRDALIQRESRIRQNEFPFLPVVGETFDGLLNDIAGQHVTSEHVEEALAAASPQVMEGCVGGGTGMIAFGFKSGIGTSSRIIDIAGRQYSLGVLVQANNASRRQLVVNGVPVGILVPPDRVPVPVATFDRDESPQKNSILVVVATDAPFLPHQLRRIAQRAALGIATTGATAHHMSGDYSLAFSTANVGHVTADLADPMLNRSISALSNSALVPFFDAVVEATAESVLNALLSAETMVGRDAHVAHALDPQLLLDCMNDYYRNMQKQSNVVVQQHIT